MNRKSTKIKHIPSGYPIKLGESYRQSLQQNQAYPSLDAEIIDPGAMKH